MEQRKHYYTDEKNAQIVIALLKQDSQGMLDEPLGKMI